MSAVITTERLALRPLVESDAEFVHGLTNEPSWLQYIGDRGVHSLADAVRYINDGPRAMYARHGFGLWMVERRADGVPMGLCGLLKRDTLAHPDIGFAFKPDFWGGGYAAEAALATIDWARRVAKLPRVVAIVQPDNAASIKLLEKLGMRYEKTIQQGESTLELHAIG